MFSVARYEQLTTRLVGHRYPSNWYTSDVAWAFRPVSRIKTAMGWWVDLAARHLSETSTCPNHVVDAVAEKRLLVVYNVAWQVSEVMPFITKYTVLYTLSRVSGNLS